MCRDISSAALSSLLFQASCAWGIFLAWLLPDGQAAEARTFALSDLNFLSDFLREKEHLFDDLVVLTEKRSLMMLIVNVGLK